MILSGGVVEMSFGSRVWFAHNLIVDSGRVLIASLMTNPSAIPPSHGVIGDGTSAPLPEQVALTGIEHLRVALVRSVSGPVAIYEAVFLNAGGSVNVNEAGIFNASSAGVMFARWLTTPFVLPTGGQFKFKWTSEAAREI